MPSTRAEGYRPRARKATGFGAVQETEAIEDKTFVGKLRRDCACVVAEST